MERLGIKDVFVLALLFVIAFFLWTVPIQNNPLPFGEGDGAWHYGNGVYAALTDQSLTKLPKSIGYWYYNFNRVLGPFALEYPPPWHLNQAIMIISGGDLTVSPYIYIAVSCFLVIFSLYFFVRKVFGFYPAVIAGSAMIFSLRDMLSYIWGQRPGITSYTYVPILLYFLYVYFEGYYKGEHKPVYLYIFTILFCSSMLMHLQGVIFIIVTTFVFLLWISVKDRKLPIGKSNLKHVLVNFLILLLVVGPFVMIYLGSGETHTDLGLNNVGRLFYWLKAPPNSFGLNPVFYTFKNAYGSNWFLLLLAIGILMMLLIRQKKEILLLSSVISLYFLLHFDVFGITILSYRIARFLSIETYIFYTIMAVAAVKLPYFLGLRKDIAKKVSLGMVIVFIVVIFALNWQDRYDTLNNSYQGVARITPAQYDAAIWMQENIPRASGVYIYGPVTYAKMRYMMVLSLSFFHWEPDNNLSDNVLTGIMGAEYVNSTYLKASYIVFDYSDQVAIGNQAKINEMLAIEDSILDKELIYNKDLIRVYKID